ARRFYVGGDRFGWLPLGSASVITWVTRSRSGRSEYGCALCKTCPQVVVGAGPAHLAGLIRSLPV
ncbi:hypothetical protein AB0C06_32570, partial [Micromonospora inaquosa]|uniref:hypothetical protein n=1 Tax=Micromonospora inaquosa TaxID=2203716 RepID=UPI0033E1DE38